MALAEQQMLSSRMTERVTFIKSEKDRQPNGSLKDEWVDVLSTWAEIYPIGGEEGRMAAAQSSTVKYVVSVRAYHLGKILPEMRIKSKFGMLEIRSILPRLNDGSRLDINAEWKQGAI